MVTREPLVLGQLEQMTTQMEQMTTTTTTTLVDRQHQQHEPLSLAESRTSDQSDDLARTSTTTPSSDEEDCIELQRNDHATGQSATDQRLHVNDQEEQQQQQVKCSAVHTLERDMPNYDYSHQVSELRELILEHARDNLGTYSPADLEKCRNDEWYLARFLLRQKMNVRDAFDMLKKAMRFNHESLANHLRPEDFPAEFYQLGAIFPFGHDRKGNKMLYMRVRMHKRTPEINSIVQAFIYYNIKKLDDEAQGKGICLVIDCSGGGLANADMDTLLFIISTLKNYFPKGLSYFLVHEIPWVLKPFWHIAKAWVPEEHKQLIKFSDARSICEYIEQDQLPDYLGGRGRAEDYKRVPENCVTLQSAAKLWGIEKPLMKRVLDKFKEHLPEETVARIEQYFASSENENNNGDEDDNDTDDGLVADDDHQEQHQEQEQERAK